MEKIAMVIMRPNSVKLILANAEPEKYFFIYNEYEEIVNIGSGLESDGVLKASKITEIIKALKMFKRICEAENVSKIYSHCAHFILQAKNQRSFLEEIESACGLQFKILNEQDETLTLYNGIINALDLPRGIMVSCEDTETYIIKYNRRSITDKLVVPFGMRSMAELFPLQPGVTPEENCEQMKDFFASQISSCEFLQNIEEEYSIVGVGSIFGSLGKLSRKIRRYPIDIANGYELTYETFNQVYDLIKTLDMDKTKKLKGISADRADVLASGLCIVKAIYDMLPNNGMIISTVDLQDGLLYNAVIPSTIEKPISDILTHSISSIASYLPISKKNGYKVLELSMLIFRQLRVLHKLTRSYVRAMKIAAYLYGCGEVINYYTMHKSSFDIILNLPIKGATHKEILLAAFISSYFDSSNFSLTEWVKYKDILNDFDLEAMKKLASIVKIAVGLDITQHGYVTDIYCDVLGDSVIMKTTSESDISFEIKYGMKGAYDFKKSFGKFLEIL